MARVPINPDKRSSTVFSIFLAWLARKIENIAMFMLVCLPARPFITS